MRKKILIPGTDEVAPTITTRMSAGVVVKKSGSKRTAKTKNVKTDFEGLVGRIQATSEALQ